MIDARYARVIALLAWAGFFLWLWLSDERVRYLGARTYWVVAFGAIALALCSLAYALSVLRSGGAGSRLQGKEAAGLSVLVLPVVAVLLVPSGTLGAAAAIKKSSQTAPPLSRHAPVQEQGAARDNALNSFVDVAYLTSEQTGAAEQGTEPGRRARVVGFVAHLDTTPEGHFELTRFAISCCVADAVPLFVRVDHRAVGEYYADDLWFEVFGTLVPGPDGALTLRASRLRSVPVPEQPYVSAL